MESRETRLGPDLIFIFVIVFEYFLNFERKCQEIEEEQF